MAALDSAFRPIKPDLQAIRMVSLRIGPWWGDSVAYVVIAMAIEQQRRWDSLAQPGEISGEIYGVFIVDSSLRRLTRTLDFFRSPRRHDYDVWIARSMPDSIIVCGRGQTYGDGTMRRAYHLEYPPPSGPEEPLSGARCLHPELRPGHPAVLWVKRRPSLSSEYESAGYGRPRATITGGSREPRSLGRARITGCHVKSYSA